MKVLNFCFSERFKRYHDELIERGGFRIEFHPHEGLPVVRDIPAYARLESGVIHVYLRSDLTDDQAELLAAHEITEPVLNRVEKYPNLVMTNLGALQKDRVKDLSARISSAILNAIVDERLKEKGFDVDKLKEVGLVTLLRTLPPVPPSINAWDIIVIGALTYLSQCLLYPSSAEIKKLTEYFEKIGGEQWRLAHDLVRIVEATGYKTIDQSLQAMIRIRDRLNLKPYLLVRDRRDWSLH